MNMEKITHIYYFLRVVELGSFSAAAKDLGTTQPNVSRHIAALEANLGCLLFRRTTRKLSLTEEGKVFYEQAQALNEKFNEAIASVGSKHTQASGTLKLASAVVFGRLHVLPRLQAFFTENPQVKVDLVMNDSFSDLIEENIDLAIRVGEVTDPNVIAKKVGLTRRMVVASPEYLKKYGKPKHPDELIAHQCIVYSKLAAGAKWRFTQNGKPFDVNIAGHLQVNNTEGVRAAVLLGLGIAFLPEWHFVDGEVEKGLLIRLFDDFLPAPQPISLVYASRKYLPLKTRQIIDFLQKSFEQDAQLKPE